MMRFRSSDLTRHALTLLLFVSLGAHATATLASSAFQNDPALTEEQLEPGLPYARIQLRRMPYRCQWPGLRGRKPHFDSFWHDVRTQYHAL